MLGQAFYCLWDWGYKFLSFELDFGDIKFTLFDFCLGSAVLLLIVYLVKRILE